LSKKRPLLEEGEQEEGEEGGGAAPQIGRKSEGSTAPAAVVLLRSTDDRTNQELSGRGGRSADEEMNMIVDGDDASADEGPHSSLLSTFQSAIFKGTVNWKHGTVLTDDGENKKLTDAEMEILRLVV
jgi:hypothetical protein